MVGHFFENHTYQQYCFSPSTNGTHSINSNQNIEILVQLQRSTNRICYMWFHKLMGLNTVYQLEKVGEDMLKP